MSNRNKTAQVISLKDGGQKVIHHTKKFNMPEYGSYASFWQNENKTAKLNSKRQIKLRKQAAV